MTRPREQEVAIPGARRPEEINRRRLPNSNGKSYLEEHLRRIGISTTPSHITKGNRWIILGSLPNRTAKY